MRRYLNEGRMLLIVTFLSFAASPRAVAQGEPITVRHNGKQPALDTPSHAVQGESLYSEFDYVAQSAARLLTGVKIGPQTSFNAGDVLLGFKGRDVERYCMLDEQHRTLGIREPTWVCLVAGPHNQFIAKYLIARGALIGRKHNLDSHCDFEPTEVPLPTNIATELDHKLFRNEVVFQGAAGGVLRLLYREFTNDLARPAFSQELTYDLGDGPVTVAVKGAKFEVLRAGNDGIEYKVLHGFD